MPAPAEPDVYGLREEPLTPRSSEPGPASVLPATDVPRGTEPSATTAPLQPPVTAPIGEYRHASRFTLDIRVLPYVAPVCVVLIFILQFFDWVGVYPGGRMAAATQSAWGAAFGSIWIDNDLKEEAWKTKKEESSPSPSVLTIFYLLLFVLLALPVTIASVVIDRIPVKLPPGLQNIMPWRFGIVAGVNLIVFFFLLLQLAFGFSIESKYKEIVKAAAPSTENMGTTHMKQIEAGRDMMLQALSTTTWLRLAVSLHLVAIIAALLMYWLERRGPSKPLPYLELRW
jgi:hypothetical protein